MDGNSGVTPLETARREAERTGTLIDLVSSDFRAAGMALDEALYEQAWRAWRAAPAYRADSLGTLATREAIAAWLAADGLPTHPDRVAVTCGSSISYRLLFEALADPALPWAAARRAAGRTPCVALPAPGYPLFEEIAREVGVEPTFYRCHPAAGWAPDPDSVEDALARDPLALVLISPNNPTGAIYSPERIARLARAAARAGVALISDEVFSLYREPDHPLPRAAAHSGGQGLVVTLNGLSKLCAAPEVKLGWMAFHGDDTRIAMLRRRIELRHDLYLTVSGFAEAAARVFLAEGIAARARLQREARRRMERLEGELASVAGIRLLSSGAPEARGGIHRVIEIERDRLETYLGSSDDEAVAERICRRSGVHLHPGYLYGLDAAEDGAPRFIVTAMRRQEESTEAIGRLAELLGD